MSEAEARVAPQTVWEYAKMRYGQCEESFTNYLLIIRGVVDRPLEELFTADVTENGEWTPVRLLPLDTQTLDAFRRQAAWWRPIAHAERSSDAVLAMLKGRREALAAMIGSDKMDPAYLSARSFYQLSTTEYVDWWARGCPEDEGELPR